MPIAGSGKYSQAEILLAPHLAYFLPALLELTQKFYESGYEWLTEFLREKVRALEVNLVREIYRATRLAFAHKPHLVEQIWLCVVAKNRGVYLFDQHRFENTIKLVATQRGAMRPSSSALFLGLLTTTVALEKLFSRHAIVSGECLRCDLAVSQYSDDKTLYAIAEHVLYRSTKRRTGVASVFPIVRDQQPYLIAAFPTDVEAEVLPILRAHSDDIRRAFKASQDELFGLVEGTKAIWRPQLPVGQIGEALGGLVKGLLGY